jgi:trk system potassium uptake protein TrkA
MFGIKKIVARIYDPPRGLMYRELGIETVCPTTVGAQMIRDKLMSMPFDAAAPFDFGKVSSVGVKVSATFAGKRVDELERDGRIRIAAIRRGDEVRVASSGDVLQLGDELSAVVAPEALSEFAQRIVSGAAPVRLTA